MLYGCTSQKQDDQNLVIDLSSGLAIKCSSGVEIGL